MSEQRPVYTLKSKPAVLHSYEEAMEVARELSPRLRERVPEAEQLRRLPDATVAELLESGLCGVMQPKHFGGSELGAETMIDVSAELGSQCPSTSWVYMLWAAHVWMQALFPPVAQEEMWANPNTLASSATHTTGDVVPVDGGFSWTGRGFFSSGVDHCNWFTASVQIKHDDPSAPPDRYWLLIPREDFEIIDDWYTVGLKGTGSKTIVAKDVFIPLERALRTIDAQEGTAPGRKINMHPMYGGTLSANFGSAMAAPSIGAARGFLNEFLNKLSSKVNLTDRPDVKRGYNPDAVDFSTTMARYASASAELDGAHLLILRNAREFSCRPAAKMSPVDRARSRRDNPFAAQRARTVVHTLFAEAGGSAVYESSDLQRLWRDTNVAGSHHGLTWDWQAAEWTKALLGVSTDARPAD